MLASYDARLICGICCALAVYYGMPTYRGLRMCTQAVRQPRRPLAASLRQQRPPPAPLPLLPLLPTVLLAPHRCAAQAETNAVLRLPQGAMCSLRLLFAVTLRTVSYQCCWARCCAARGLHAPDSRPPRVFRLARLLEGALRPLSAAALPRALALAHPRARRELRPRPPQGPQALARL